jgi:Glycosyl hydrolases family 2, sugar binding domain/Glycosyl hydrolases family 2, TIM barrel domain/Glycosyl hydrolases family 2
VVAPKFPLDGVWSFLHVSNDTVNPAEVRDITVPGVWQAQFHDLRMRAGIGVFLREFTLPPGWLRDRVFLRFGAVFHHARVWVNERYVGDHEGGFLPFAFDVTQFLSGGTNQIKVRVESPTDDPSEFSEAPLAEIPFGKQSWYGPLSGIWQSVYLERRAADHIARIRVRCEPDSGEVRAEIAFAAKITADTKLDMSITSPRGEAVAYSGINVRVGQENAVMHGTVPQVLAWSPNNPHLYRLKLVLTREGCPVDEAEETFGFRTIKARDGRLYLNGELLYLRGALDQDYYPDTICTPPSVEFLEDQLRKAKELGLNCLRCHIKAPDPRYYEVADRMGMLIWAELPNGGFSTEKSRARKEDTLMGIVDRDANHPSIICWTIINENWGVDLVHDPDHREWLSKLYLWLKAYDPSRLVVDNSPVAPSFHVCTDIADYHYYAGYPDDREDWDKFVKGFAARADWLFSPHGDAVTSHDEPLVCSEFGNWGLPDPELLRDGDGSEPWWFETGHDWNEGVMYAHGVENRFRDWSLDRAFGSFEAFVKAAQWQQFRALKYEIEAMRRRPEIAGYVITELTDCHWESNGLLDFRRNPRVFHDVFGTINADTVIVPKWERLALWDDEELQLGVAIAHAANAVENATLGIFLDRQQVKLSLRLEPGVVLDLGKVTLPLPQIETPRTFTVSFELRRQDEAVIAINNLEIAVHPRRVRTARLEQNVWSPNESLRERLGALGYAMAREMDTADIVVATESEQELAAYVRNGGKLLLLPEAEGTLNPYFPHWQKVEVQNRKGTVWRGEWASSFAWLRRHNAFALLPGGPLINETFDRVIPDAVISGCNLLDFQARVHAGLVVGWIHKPVALIVERGYGKGRLLATTFRLFRDETNADPTATALLQSLIQALAGTQAPRPEQKSLPDRTASRYNPSGASVSEGGREETAPEERAAEPHTS